MKRFRFSLTTTVLMLTVFAITFGVISNYYRAKWQADAALKKQMFATAQKRWSLQTAVLKRRALEDPSSANEGAV